jgi:hypothetical protein
MRKSAGKPMNLIARRDVCRSIAVSALALLPCSRLLVAAAPAPVTVNWQTLQTLNFSVPVSQQKGAVLQLDNKRVSIPGFMVPLEDDLDQVTEFLLVPYAGACIHVPPPPPNQIVYVKMRTNAKVQVTFTDPILVTGTLHISTVQSPYGAVSYDLAGDSVVPYQPQ